MNPRHVLVCGSNYGTAYIRAVLERPDSYQLAGLLARGSPRSHRVALKFDLPFYTTVTDVPASVTLACAAMGTAAFEVVIGLLERGIHVLLEHPVRFHDLERAAAVAARHEARLHVQTLFASLTAPREFIARCRARTLTEPPTLIELLVTDRSLYAALDILSQAAGGLEPLMCDDFKPDPWGRFDTLNGTLRGVPAIVRVQRSRLADGRHLADGAPEYLVDCRMIVWFPDGVLTLLSVAGPVVWNASFRETGARDEPAWRADTATPSTFAGLMKQRTEANLGAIDALRAHADGGDPPLTQSLDHKLEIARVWEYLVERLGPRTPGA